jgi:nitrous oxide reductase accessory protein NosL
VSGWRLASLVLFAALAGLLPTRLLAAAEPQPAGATFSCAECGMSGEVAGRYTARLVGGGATRYFCDIGDLVAFIRRTRPNEFSAAVRDFPSGEWIDASAAFFVIDKKNFATPMGWGIAAFRDSAAAPGTALGWEALGKALR